MDRRSQTRAMLSCYPAGDALSFVDPFTGSGLLAAVRSGAMAGKAAAIGQPVAEYLRECRASLRQPFQVAGVLRRALEGGWAEKLAPLRRPFAVCADASEVNLRSAAK